MSLKILITGGAGFIGSSLGKKLKSLNHDVYLLDLPSKFKKNLESPCKSIQADVSHYVTLQNSVPHVDVIFHFAAQTSGAISQEQPELDVDTNIRGTLNICRLARELKVRKIIFSSSMAVYGEGDKPFSETSPYNPKSVYGCSKVAAETFIKSFSQFGFDYTIFRFFNVYGPGQDMKNLRQGMASIFMAQALMGKEILVTGSLKRFRDFIYIDDVVSALCMAIKGMNHETYNVGSGIKTTVDELIPTIIGSINEDLSTYTIRNIGSHDGDPFGTVSDCSKLRSLGWKPKVSLSDGLRLMAEYARKELSS